MDDRDLMIFSLNFFLMSYNYVVLIFKYKKHSLKDLINYTEPQGLIYCKLNR